MTNAWRLMILGACTIHFVHGIVTRHELRIPIGSRRKGTPFRGVFKMGESPQTTIQNSGWGLEDGAPEADSVQLRYG